MKIKIYRSAIHDEEEMRNFLHDLCANHGFVIKKNYTGEDKLFGVAIVIAPHHINGDKKIFLSWKTVCPIENNGGWGHIGWQTSYNQEDFIYETLQFLLTQ